MSKPLVIDLYAGLGGWADGFLAEGWRCVGFDIEHHVYGEHRYPAQLVLQDVRTIHGKQFRDASMIVASSPCQEFSYRAMPWKRAKALGPPVLGMELFAQAARIQREACEAAGRYIPMIQENVKGAQKYVGRAAWHFGSFYLWGDVPALMPIAARGVMKDGVAHRSNGETNFHASAKRAEAHHFPQVDAAAEGVKQRGSGREWFAGKGTISGTTGSKSPARKAASARIAKIPAPLARFIAYTFHPERLAGAA